jgi:phosphoserine phosphatase
MLNLRRQSVVRLFCATLIASMALWLVAPVTGAQARQATALSAEFLRTEARGTVDADFEAALAEAAAVAAGSPLDFVEAFVAALKDGRGIEPDRYFASHEIESLLTLIYGQILTAQSQAGGMLALLAPAGSVVVPVSPTGGTTLFSTRAASSDRQPVPSLVALADAPPVVVQRFERSAAQPLGP